MRTIIGGFVSYLTGRSIRGIFIMRMIETWMYKDVTHITQLLQTYPKEVNYGNQS